MRYPVSVILVTLSMAASTVAQAQDQPTPAAIRAAAEAFDRGREAYKDEEFQEAAEQFERADANAPSTTALELAIRSRDQAGNSDRAATLAALALSRHPDDATLVSLAEEVLARTKPGLYELRVTCAEPCELIADSKIVHGERSIERTVYLLPGAHTVVAGFGEGRTESQQVEAMEGNSGELAFAPSAAQGQATAEPTPAETVPEDEQPPTHDQGTEPASGGWSPAVFWVGASLTAVAGGITIWSGVDTLNDPGASRVRDECEDENCPLYQEGVEKQNRTNVLIGVTGALGLGTILIGALATDWSGGGNREEAAKTRAVRSQGAFRSVEVAPWFGTSGGGLTAQGRF